MNDMYKVRPVPTSFHLAEEIAERGWSVHDLRRKLHVDTLVFIGMMTGRVVIRGHLARELARVFDTSPEFWVTLDRQWREGR